MRRALFALLLTACASPAPKSPSPSPTAAPTATTPPIEPAPAPPSPPDRFATRVIGGDAPNAHARYSGKRIDLDLKSADLRDVCRLLADVGNVNIVVSDDVQGSVTVKMKSVPWDQALDVILESKGLSAERDGRMILVTRGATR